MRGLQFIFNVFEIACFIVLGEVVEMPLSLHYNKALNMSPFRILFGLSVHDCWKECQGRLKCLSMNYKATICELNEMRHNVNLPLSERIGSVYQEKPFGPQPDVVKCGSNVCGMKEVCDYKTGLCSVKECEPFPLPQNGVMLGNDFSIGRRMRIGCMRGYVSSTGSLVMQMSTCLPDGTWDINPFKCIAATSTTVTTTPMTTTTYSPLIIEQWASNVTRFSSQYSNTRWNANQVIGPPDVYPTYGDIDKAWAQETLDANQFIEIQFKEAVHVINLTIYETYHAGGVKSIKAKNENGKWVQLWSTAVVKVNRTSRMFTPPLSALQTSTRDFRIDVDCTVSDSWVEIDAVKLVGTK